MARTLSQVYDVAWKLRSVDPELPRATLIQFFTCTPQVYKAIPKGNAQDLIVGELDYIVTNDDGELVIL